MQELNMVEVGFVSGGAEVQVVVIQGKRMTDAEKREYDRQHNWSWRRFLEMFQDELGKQPRG